MAGFWGGYSRIRISRRHALQRGMWVAGATGALAFAGCSSSEDGAESTPQSVSGPGVLNGGGAPRRGGTLVSAFAAPLGTFDPHLGSAVAATYYPRIYNVLFNQSAVQPGYVLMDLAESFEVPDAQTYIFRIRDGVRVAPNDLGVPERYMDGEDVRLTLERIKTTPAAQNYAFAKNNVESVDVADNTVTVTAPRPYAWFINRIGLFVNTIPPRELLSGDLDRLATKGVGGGPYRLDSVTDGQTARLSRNPNYYRTDNDNADAQLPYLDALEVRVILDKATQRTAFQSGQIHQYATGNRVEAESLDNAVISRDPFFSYISFSMNAGRKPYDDPRVRRAISRAINRQQYVDLVYEGDAQANGLVQWSLGDYALPRDELQQLQPYNLQEARALVDQLGGLKIRMMYPASAAILEHDSHLPIFLEQMAAANVEVEKDPQDIGTWVTNYIDVNYDCALALNQIYETPELPLGFHATGGPLGDGTVTRPLNDPEIDAAVRNAREELDFEARVQAVHDAQRLIYAKDPITFPLVTPYIHVASRKEVRNITTGIGTTAFLVNNSWLDV